MSDVEGYPEEFYCPVCCDLMTDPVVDTNGNTYERNAIETWIHTNATSPITRQPLTLIDLRPNRTLKNMIDRAKQQRAADHAALSAMVGRGVTMAATQAYKWMWKGWNGLKMMTSGAVHVSKNIYNATSGRAHTRRTLLSLQDVENVSTATAETKEETKDNATSEVTASLTMVCGTEEKIFENRLPIMKSQLDGFSSVALWTLRKSWNGLKTVTSSTTKMLYNVSQRVYESDVPSTRLSEALSPSNLDDDDDENLPIATNVIHLH